MWSAACLQASHLNSNVSEVANLCKYYVWLRKNRSEFCTPCHLPVSARICIYSLDSPYRYYNIGQRQLTRIRRGPLRTKINIDSQKWARATLPAPSLVNLGCAVWNSIQKWHARLYYKIYIKTHSINSAISYSAFDQKLGRCLPKWAYSALLGRFRARAEAWQYRRNREQPEVTYILAKAEMLNLNRLLTSIIHRPGLQ